MSAFQPENYEEAKATHKPLSRKKPPRAVITVSAMPSPSSGRKLAGANGIKRRGGTSRRMKRPKKLTPGQLKKRAWKQFSIYIRTRGADEQGLNACATCGVRKPWSELQAGHFIAGRLNSTLFDERGVHPQCSLCNVVKHGNGPMYYKFMLATYGQEVIDELIEQNNVTRKWLPGELKQLWDRYRALNAENPLVQKG